MTRTSSYVLRFSLIVPVGAAACGEDNVGVAEGGSRGIESVGGDGSSGTAAGTSTGADDSTGAPVDRCENELLDGDESDIDCGGSCEPCGPGGQCGSDDDCDTMICSGGFCQTPTCYDGLQNGSEDGVDCGSGCPNDCIEGGCGGDGQCEQGEFCLDGECMPSSCENDLQDTLESDVDCGGPDCPDCAPADSCDVDADCETDVCGDDGLCAFPACDDTVLNGDETDVDCGGSCEVCPLGGDCVFGSDCIEGVCDAGTCIDDTCTDFVANGQETDLDCGGPVCPVCVAGQDCDDGSDCDSGVCIAGLCVGAFCDDMVHNGDETDVDCGGSCGATCVPGQDCDSSNDCVEGVCEFGQCSAPDCSDGIPNGDETDMDCGGSCGATCIPGEMCTLPTDCAEGVCDAGLCSVPSCMDAVENGDETDTDCGGVCGATCVPGENCADGGDCADGVCILGVCQPPACDDGFQNGMEQGIDCAGVCDQPCPFGSELVVNTTVPDFQVQPAVAAAPGGAFHVVTWASFPVLDPPQDGDGAGIYARVYDPMGAPVTGEILVNTSTVGNQAFPAVDANDAGFVISWQGPDGNGNGVFAQRFDGAGGPLGAEIVVNETPDDEQRRPDVAVEDTGEFVVCWEDQPLTFDIVCRQFTAGGAPAGPEQVVHTVSSDNQNLAVVEVADSGEYTVVWQSAGNQDGDSVGVFMRRFSAAGVPVGGPEIQVNQFSALDQQGPAIGMNPSGEFVIAWSSDDQDGSSTGIFARRYNALGSAQGGEFPVTTTTAGAQNNPVVALNPDGDFVIAWQTADDGVLTGIFAQRYDQDGVAFSAEFVVNPTVAGLQEEPDVAIRGTEEIIGVWSEGDVGFTDRNIRLQRYAGQFP